MPSKVAVTSKASVEWVFGSATGFFNWHLVEAVSALDFTCGNVSDQIIDENHNNGAGGSNGKLVFGLG